MTGIVSDPVVSGCCLNLSFGKKLIPGHPFYYVPELAHTEGLSPTETWQPFVQYSNHFWGLKGSQAPGSEFNFWEFAPRDSAVRESMTMT